MQVTDLLPQVVLTLLTVVIIPVIVQGVKLWRDKYNPGEALQKKVMTLLVTVLSLIAGFIWFRPEIPPITDPINFLVALVGVASPWFFSVKLVYDYILDALFQKLGWITLSKKAALAAKAAASPGVE